MPWGTVLDPPLLRFTLGTAHDAIAYPSGGVAWYVDETPASVLRRLLAHHTDVVPSVVVEFVTSSELLSPSFAAVLPLIGGPVAIPHPHRNWVPFPIAAWTPEVVTSTYAALVLRVSIVENLCRGLREQQATSTDGVARSRGIARIRKDACFLDVEPHEIDTLSHYLHLWLDAHLLLCICMTEYGFPPEGKILADMLDAYAPSHRTLFHEGELPRLTGRLDCGFWFDADPTDDPFVELLRMVIPNKNRGDAIVREAARLAVADEQHAQTLRVIVAASLLGVYRHARRRPALSMRLALYRTFFFTPSDGLQEHITASLKARGVTRPTEWRAIGGAVGARAHTITTAWSTDSYYALDQFVRVLSVCEPESRNRPRVALQCWFPNCLREFLVQHLTMTPVPYGELCAMTQWAGWQQTLFQYMDFSRMWIDVRNHNPLRRLLAMPASPYGYPDNKILLDYIRPFVRVLHETCEKAWRNCPGLRPTADGVVTFEHEYRLEQFLRAMPYNYERPLIATSVLPSPTATPEEVMAHFCPRNMVPLRLFHMTSETIDHMNRTQHDLAKGLSTRCAVRFIESTAETSLFQFQLVAAYARIAWQCMSTGPVLLPAHLARLQAQAVRERYNVPPQEVVPSDAVQVFLCMNCNCVACVSDHDCPDAADIVHGRVGAIPDTLDVALARAAQDRASILPTRAHIPGDMELASFFAEETRLLEKRDDWPDTESDGSPRALAALIDIPDPPWTRQPFPDPPRELQSVAVDSRSRAIAFGNAYAQKYGEGLERACAGSSLQPLRWVCGNNRVKKERKKVKEGRESDHRIANAITEADRRRQEAVSETKQFRDARTYYRSVLCSNRLVVPVSLVGQALRVGPHVLLACCNCLTITTLHTGQWYDSSFVCRRCARDALDVGELQRVQGGQRRCLICKRYQQPRELFRETLAWNDLNVGYECFTTVMACASDFAKTRWLFASPLVPSMSMIVQSLSEKWKSLSNWDATVNYLRGRANATPEEEVELPNTKRPRLRSVGRASVS